MQINKITVSTLKIPLNRIFKTAIRSTDYLEDLFITIEADGIVGYGSAPATTAITGDTIEGMQSVMEKIVLPNLLGINPLDRLTIQQTILKKFAGNSGVKMAVDMALFDLAAKAANMPLYQYLGGSNHSLTTDVTISCGNIHETEKHVHQALNKGFKILKVKLGKSIHDDIATCHALAACLPKDCLVRIDANQGWTQDETLYFLDELTKINLNIECIEQPVAASNLVGMQTITAKSKWLIMADESVFHCADALRVLQTNAANLINIKLAKCGGIANAIKIKNLADTYHTECMIGCMMESPLGIAAAAHFALATGISKIDLDPLDWISNDLYDSWLTFKNAKIELSTRPGIGYIPV
jgi:L-alanine-DL-glutamate epimerase-like enolase superfamily enzyme